MIGLNRLNEFLIEMQAAVNLRIDPTAWVLSDGLWIDSARFLDSGVVDAGATYGQKIDCILVSPTEKHLIKKLSDKKGIILAVKLPDADSQIEDVDNYSELNHQLFFILEKVDPGAHNDTVERQHYVKMQNIMTLVKEYIKDRGMNGNVCGGDETLAAPFHTEWEYQAYGTFNGLSVSFDLQDFGL